MKGDAIVDCTVRAGQGTAHRHGSQQEFPSPISDKPRK
jgi:hypothetical protein